jgi:uncharacterized protein (TIGR02246 family)
MNDNEEMGRPRLGSDGSMAVAAGMAVGQLVAELQRGWYGHDAEISNRHFAEDVVWGSPDGAIVRGYEDVHAIHARLKEESGGCRFEIQSVTAPAPGVAIAHVRRVGLDPEGCSEMAMYVLVRRDETWWVAAGQVTVVGGGGNRE